MELKKQRLLVMLHPMEGEEGEEKVGVVSGTDQLQRDGREREVEDQEETEVVGMKCRAPLKEVRMCSDHPLLLIVIGFCDGIIVQSWGSVNYHNAMVLCVEPQDEQEQDDEVKVTVWNKGVMRSVNTFSLSLSLSVLGSCFIHSTPLLWYEALPILHGGEL